LELSAYSQGEEEAKRTVCIVFEQKYPNRDLNLALSEFDALLQTTIAPEIHAAAEAARRANRPPYGRIIVALGIGFFLLETFGGNHAVQPSSTAPLVKPSIDMPAAAVIAN
jgi:hypothetical protein